MEAFLKDPRAIMKLLAFETSLSFEISSLSKISPFKITGMFSESLKIDFACSQWALSFGLSGIVLRWIVIAETPVCSMIFIKSKVSETLDNNLILHVIEFVKFLFKVVKIYFVLHGLFVCLRFAFLKKFKLHKMKNRL